MVWLKRILGWLLTLFLTLSVVFLLVRLAPGGPFASEKGVAPEVRARLEAQYGLNDPLPMQLAKFWGNLAVGNFGVSVTLDGAKVTDLISQAFPYSLALGALALMWAIVGGIPLGFYWAARGKPDWTRTAMLGALLPSFVAAPVIQWLVYLSGGPAYGCEKFWLGLIWPSVGLGLYYLPFVARLTQEGFVGQERALYVRVAQAKGLSRLAALFLHGWRAALTPVVAYLGPTAAGLITGTFVAETVWGIPGLGKFFVNAVFNRDDTLILGVTAFYLVILMAFNAVVEAVLMQWNPSAKEAQNAKA